MTFWGLNCPVCAQKLENGQNIVVCPECGAPYHKKCYLDNGSCVFEEKHSAGFEYIISKQKEQSSNSNNTSDKNEINNENSSDNLNDKTIDNSNANSDDTTNRENADKQGSICKKCGTINDVTNIFCENCGAPMQGEQRRASSSFEKDGPNFGLSLEGEIDGVSKKDLYKFIGPSADVYMLRITQQHLKNSKITVMLSPFLFPQFYFAYRKMWGWAVLAVISTVLLSIPSLFTITLETGGTLPFVISPVALGYIRVATETLQLLSRFAFGFFALYLYRKQSVKKIKLLKEKGLEQAEYQEMLKKSGGISYLGLGICVAVILVVSFIISYFFGSTLSNYLLSIF